MQVIDARQPFPDRWTTALFLAGPTPRAPEVGSWRPAALEHLARHNFDGVVFVPEDAAGTFRGDYLDQVEWERDGLRFADRIVFWVPRALDTLPGFTTNVEFGRWVASGKVTLGFPESAPKTQYLAWLAGQENVETCDTLAATLDAALARARPALRAGGERFVPQHIWHTPIFQSWYTALQQAGRRLDEAEPLWHYHLRRCNQIFAWILKVKVWVAAEARHKSNEWGHAARYPVSAAAWRAVRHRQPQPSLRQVDAEHQDSGRRPRPRSLPPQRRARARRNRAAGPRPFHTCARLARCPGRGHAITDWHSPSHR